MGISEIAGLAIGLVLLAAETPAQGVGHGADDYKLCASCHGFKGEGNPLVNAPALAGQESWYLECQIRNFRDGVRGSASGNTHGKAMTMMARGLESDEKIADIVAYIGKLPAPHGKATVAGDASRGKTHYADCHGSAAKGNAALNAPALTTTEDWYQVRQLKLFKKGLRGTHPDDTYGQQIRPMAGVLADDAAINDVVSYINSLRQATASDQRD